MLLDWIESHPDAQISTDTLISGYDITLPDFIMAPAKDVVITEGHYSAVLRHEDKHIAVHSLKVTGETSRQRVLRGYTYHDGMECGIIIRLSGNAVERSKE